MQQKKNIFFKSTPRWKSSYPIQKFYEWVSDDWWYWWWFFDGLYECFFLISISSEEKFKGKPDMVSSASIESNSFFRERFGEHLDTFQLHSAWYFDFTTQRILLTSVQLLKMVWSSDFKCVLAVFSLQKTSSRYWVSYFCWNHSKIPPKSPWIHELMVNRIHFSGSD